MLYPTRLESNREKQQTRIEQLSPLLVGGNTDHGWRVFFSSKALCGSCHQVGVKGGRVGPSLTGIGTIRSGHDLLEAIVFPSSSFVRGF
jgi:cytochrome c551/c552